MGENEPENIQALDDMGVNVITLQGHPACSPIGHLSNSGMLKSRIRRLLQIPKTTDLLVGAHYAPAVAQIVNDIRPDVVFAYHWQSLADIAGIHGFRKLALVGDPLHLPVVTRGAFQRRHSDIDGLRNLRRRLSDRLYQANAISIMRRLLGTCDRTGAFAAHHAEMLREIGAPLCEYFRTPVPDPLSKIEEKPAKPVKFKIMHIGHLRGIATLTGVELLANELLPFLCENLPHGSFEVHIVGRFAETLPADIRRRLDRPEVIFRGQVTPADDEFLSSHVLLVPTPVELGIRVRIITAFAFGCCVVAHRANTKGIPELAHRKNALVGDDGWSLGALCVDVFHSAELRQHLEVGARETYKKHFSIEAAGKAIVQAMEKVIDA